jgi:hypothetical protein
VTREEEGTQPGFWPVYGTGKACDDEEVSLAWRWGSLVFFGVQQVKQSLSKKG